MEKIERNCSVFAHFFTLFWLLQIGHLVMILKWTRRNREIVSHWNTENTTSTLYHFNIMFFYRAFIGKYINCLWEEIFFFFCIASMTWNFLHNIKVNFVRIEFWWLKSKLVFSFYINQITIDSLCCQVFVMG